VLAGVIVGLLFTTVHIAATIRAGQAPSFETAAQLVLSGVGIGTGLRVLKICVTADTLQPFSDMDRAYIMLGGLLLIWISVSTIVKNVFSKDEPAG
jgi:hypothetical protein